MSRKTHLSRSQLAALASDEGCVEGRDHVSECESCRKQVTDFEADLAVMRSAPIPPADERTRQQHVLRAMARGASHRQAVPWRPSLAWLGGSVGVAALAAALFFVLRSSPTPLGAIVNAGMLVMEGHQELPPGSRVDTDKTLTAAQASGATLRLADGSQVRASEGSVFLLPAHGTAVSMQSGSLGFEVTHQPSGVSFTVETDEARVRVVGTRFEVARDEGPPARTRISVSEGRVEVLNRVQDRAAVMLDAGESIELPIEPAGPALDAGLDVLDAGQEGLDGAVEAGEVKRLPGVSEIRRTLRSGRVTEALEMIRQVRASRRAGGAEFAMVEAEALLASGQGGRAVQAYLDVTRRYPGTRQAEEALFAAAQLSVDYSGRSQRGQVLLREYLQRYPSGRFHSEARRVLAALEAKKQ